MADRAQRFRADHDAIRRALCTEPRGSDVMVGGMLCSPSDPSCTIGVLFFNNVDVLGMCGHGTIGLITTLAWLGRIDHGVHRIETPVGVVTAELHEDGRVSVENVLSYRHATRVPLEVPGLGLVHGDIAWGGNWFFLVSDHGLVVETAEIPALLAASRLIRSALDEQGVTGAKGGLIDHIELFGPGSAGCDSRSFVLCPGGEYDRSPCGTGTSAKLACLAADGALADGHIWRQESVIGSVFEGHVRCVEGGVMPTITGRAHIIADCRMVVDEDDPFAYGIAGHSPAQSFNSST